MLLLLRCICGVERPPPPGVQSELNRHYITCVLTNAHNTIFWVKIILFSKETGFPELSSLISIPEMMVMYMLYLYVKPGVSDSLKAAYPLPLKKLPSWARLKHWPAAWDDSTALRFIWTPLNVTSWTHAARLCVTCRTTRVRIGQTRRYTKLSQK